MQTPGDQAVRDIVLAGAGHAHVSALREFGLAPPPGARLTLITPEILTPYSGMLPGLIAGRCEFHDAHIDAARLARFAKARLVQDEAIGIDTARRLVICRNLPPVPYDLLSLNIGSAPDTGDVPGAAEYAISVKPIDGFLAAFEGLRRRAAARSGPWRLALAGAGAGGVELILAIEHRLRREAAQAGRDAMALAFTLVSDTDDILPAFPAAFRARFRKILAAHGIDAATGAGAARVEPGGLILSNGTRIAADEILMATPARPAAWLADTGLPLDARGFLRVDQNLQAEGRPDIFAAGDVIAFAPRALPHSGVYAVRAGPTLAGNLRRALAGRPLKPFRPQRQALYLLSDSAGRAVGTRNGLVFEGAWALRWKERIDRAFMRRFAGLPDG